MAEECRFELSVALCADCRRETDEPGTCTDYALCYRCMKHRAEELGCTVEEYRREHYGPSKLLEIEGHQYRPIKRVLHYDAGNGPVCHPKGGPHPVTLSRNETNCKKCVRILARGSYERTS